MTARRGNRLLIVLISAAVLAVGSGFGVMALFVRLPDVRPGGAPPAKAAAMQVLTQRAGGSDLPLFSHSPLFQPTTVNASRVELPRGIEQEANVMVLASPPKYMFAAEGTALDFGPPFAHRFTFPRTPAEAVLVTDSPVNHFQGIGRINRPVKPLPARLGFLEVAEAATGRIVEKTALAATADGPSLANWQPLHLYLAVDESGLVADPIVVQSSGQEPVDSFFQSFLTKTFNIGKRLEPGFYRVRVGP